MSLPFRNDPPSSGSSQHRSPRQEAPWEQPATLPRQMVIIKSFHKFIITKTQFPKVGMATPPTGTLVYNFYSPKIGYYFSPLSFISFSPRKSIQWNFSKSGYVIHFNSLNFSATKSSPLSKDDTHQSRKYHLPQEGESPCQGPRAKQIPRSIQKPKGYKHHTPLAGVYKSPVAMPQSMVISTQVCPFPLLSYLYLFNYPLFLSPPHFQNNLVIRDSYTTCVCMYSIRVSSRLGFTKSILLLAQE